MLLLLQITSIKVHHSAQQKLMEDLIEKCKDNKEQSWKIKKAGNYSVVTVITHIFPLLIYLILKRV